MPGLGMMGRLLLRAPSAGGVVHELEEREIEPRFFLGDAAMRSPSLASERSEGGTEGDDRD